MEYESLNVDYPKAYVRCLGFMIVPCVGFVSHENILI